MRTRVICSIVGAVAALGSLAGCGEDGSSNGSIDNEALDQGARAALTRVFQHPRTVCDVYSQQQLIDSFGGVNAQSTPAEALRRCRRFARTQKPMPIQILSSKVVGAERVRLDVAIARQTGTQVIMWRTGGRWVIERIE